MENLASGRLARIPVALGIIAAITFVDFRIPGVNSTTVALTFLLAILAIAARWGLTEAVAASILGVICINYFFLPPVRTFTIADPQNWIALFAFLITAIVASQLSASAKNRAAEATRRQHEMEKLYALGRSLLLLDSGSGVAGQLAQSIAQVFGLKAAALFERASDRVYLGGPEELALPEARLRDAAIQGAAFDDAKAGITVLPVRLGGPATGSLAVPSGSVSDTALHAIANLAAITLERGRAQELATRAEAARQNQELKSTLLDALAHEFKTPLTSIKAAVSGLLAGGELATEELLTIVEEETDRLDSLVSEAIQMARIEAGQVRLEREPLNVAELISSALKKTGRAILEREVRLDVPPDLPPVLADRELAGLVIRQLIGNSLKYADPGSPIEIRARAEGGQAILTIADRGPGIPEREQARIFERFYRIPTASGAAPGTGMGLAIARDIVEAHGGALQVHSRAGEGSEFSFTIPLLPKEATRERR